MPVFLGDIVQVSIVGRCYSQRIILTNMYRVTQSGTPGTTVNANLTAMLVALDVGGAVDLMTKYTDVLQTDYLSLSLRAQVIKPVRLAYVDLLSNHPGTGGAGSVANDSAAVTLRTAASGRSQVATKHIGPIPDGVSVSGVLSVSYISALDDLAAKLLASFQPGGAGASYAPIIYHRATDTSDPLVNSVIGEQSRVQRRRTVGLGI